MGWKDEARRTIVGDKKELGTFPGYWIRPRKYSIESLDEIRAIEKKQQSEFTRRSMAKLAKKMSGIKDLTPEAAAEMSPLDLMKNMDEEEVEALYEMMDSKHNFQAQILTAKLKGGVGEHNFEGTKITELAKELIEYPDIAREVVEIIDEYNRPLATRPSEALPQSPDGSTNKENSMQTVKTSQTEETHGT
jgi:hypothetical protein